MRDAAMLWTGGKDSSMALYEAGRNNCRVRCLVTFAPPGARFLAHPLDFIELQAEALALPHHVLPISEPFAESYERALAEVRDRFGVDGVVTGDIAEVERMPNWIRERCRAVGMRVITPLWKRDRRALLEQLLSRGFRARISCVDVRWLPEDWVGRELDDAAVTELCALSRQTGMDPCGEAGEYHTLVVDGPQFARGIDIRSFSRRRTDSLAYMDIHELAPATPGRRQRSSTGVADHPLR